MSDKSMDAPLQIGERVFSCSVGIIPAFEGEVVFSHYYQGHRDFTGWYFHVRDSEGNEWHRTPAELNRAALKDAA